ncbi:LSU ribosomal protein L35p [Fructilactobacillus florum 8D]|uniref:Large ribosomal subunit protein bL35 n=2 Tax=Fructilactobacillus florum TaxID=640331 RepID=W9EKD5_9LACO|nr:50S ribosomal protein L35 [Fructilactobacillus florum]EKK20679.1 LSU ribosomal protein L35p [Fructilactobacillus florum 2F]ETO40144.1 LSU ribosomal protein L35p [Fructilactobacillus florum 8D]KRM91836.1 hypothetical protein FC87_GL000661 [Fructilactobacillus florum DSM 22689 = JCM 16035]
MPKMKSNRAVAKRFKKTAKGGLKSAHAFTSHRFHGKTKKQRRHLRGTRMIDPIWVKSYSELLKK